MKRILLCIASLLLLMAAPAWPDDMSRSLRFAPGKSSAVLSGVITGYDTATYFLDINGGQRLLVSMSASNGQNYFNVTGAAGTALFIGSTSGNSYSGVTRRTGTYRIDVYLMRAAARRGESSRYKLAVTIPAGGGMGGDEDGDFADGDAGGPDQWVVVGVPPGDRLNVRLVPNPGALVVDRLKNGAVVANKGCRRDGGARWCRIKTAKGSKGWVNGGFLREY